MKFLLGVNLILFVLIMPFFASASGIITQAIKVEDVMRGQVIEDMVSVINSGDSETMFELGAEGDIAGWVTFKKAGDVEGFISEVIAPPNEWARARVFIKVPDDTPNGEYVGEITALVKPVSELEQEGENVTANIVQKFRRSVNIIVTDVETVDFDFKVMPEKYTIGTIEPLTIKIIYNNNGNIAIRPQAQIKIFGPDNEEMLNAIYPYPENESPVKPLASKMIEIVHYSGTLAKGQYWVEAVASLNGEEMDKKGFNFTVDTDSSGKDDDTKVMGWFDSFNDSKNYNKFIVLGGLLAVVIIVTALVLAKRKK